MSLMKFYFTPGACSIGIHVLLQELDLLFEAYPVDLLRGETQTPEFLAINPKGTIPVLVLEDGTALTDFVSIAWWLGRQNPQAGWIPADPKAEAAQLERLNYAVHVIHGQGFTRVFTPARYSSDPADHPGIEAEGRVLAERGLQYLNRLLMAEPEQQSRCFSVSDAALFYIEFWADRSGMTMPAACLQHYRNLLQRPAVRQVLMEEGYYSTLNSQQPPQAKTSCAGA